MRKTNRKGFLLGLLSVVGVGKAQTIEIGNGLKLDDKDLVPFGVVEATLPVPNGQCPVCVTQAEPIARVHGNTLKRFNGKLWIDLGNQAVLQRCKVCSCAFWQDVEKEEKK